jgi:hypothetical protein
LNTAKVSYTEDLVAANAAVVLNTAKVSYTEAAVSANTDVAANTAKVGVTTHAIGDTYGGGIVFFVYDGGQHGLIAATADQSAGIQWYNATDAVTNAVRDGIGAGEFNTERIIANQGTGAYAAQICANYQEGNYGDWYLPSKHELNLLYLQKAVVAGFAASYYWSSTEKDKFNAWGQYFYFGNQTSSAGKGNTLNVRAVRAF